MRTLISIEEFESMCDQLGPCELVRGEVLQLSPGGHEHSRITATIAALLGSWAKSSGRGRALSGEAGICVETDPPTVRGADVAFLSYERLPKGRSQRGFATIAPELVVEIVGRGQTWARLVEKTGEYFRMGVSRVWIIAPDTRCMHVFRPDIPPQVLTESDEVRDEEILPGFVCSVERMFED